MTPNDAYNLGRLQGESLQLLKLWTPDRPFSELLPIIHNLHDMEQLLQEIERGNEP